MTEIIHEYLETIGPSNVLSFILFLAGVLVSIWLEFKSIYRLVYSSSRVCKDCTIISDWTNNEMEFTSRIMFYNNGHKTIIKNEIKKLELKSTGKIISVKHIKGNETIKTKINGKKNIVVIELEYLDSSEFFVLEVNHFGSMEVDGRITESGRLLHTEPRFWVSLNVLFLILFFITILYNLITAPDKNAPFTSELITNFCVFIGIFIVLRFIHAILFIPDSISGKYLDKKDKFAKEFKN